MGSPLLLALVLAAPPATSEGPPFRELPPPSPTTASPATTAPPASLTPAPPASPTTAPPAPTAPPASPTPAPPAPTYPPARDRVRFRLDDVSMLSIGLGGGARIDARNFGAPAGERTSHGRVTERSGMADLRFRVIGWDERPANRVRWFVLPDIHQSFLFGGTAARQDAAAIANDHPIRRKGGFFGLMGHVGGTGGLATPGRGAIYLKGSLTILGLIGGTTEGAYIQAPLGLGLGPRLSLDKFKLMLGPKLDAVLGAQGVAGPRLILQLAPGADLISIVELGHKSFLALTGSLDFTALGQRYGGQRTLGRATLDLVLRVRPEVRLHLFATYRGLVVAGAPDAPGFPAEGLTATSHVALLGLGVGG